MGRGTCDGFFRISRCFLLLWDIARFERDVDRMRGGDCRDRFVVRKDEGNTDRRKFDHRDSSCVQRVEKDFYEDVMTFVSLRQQQQIHVVWTLVAELRSVYGNEVLFVSDQHVDGNANIL